MIMIDHSTQQTYGKKGRFHVLPWKEKEERAQSYTANEYSSGKWSLMIWMVIMALETHEVGVWVL